MADAPLRPSAGVVFRELDGETVILHLDSGKYFGLNEVATDIWLGLDRGEDLPAIVRKLAGEYDIPGDTAYRDAVAFLEELRNRGLIEGTLPPAAG